MGKCTISTNIRQKETGESIHVLLGQHGLCDGALIGNTPEDEPAHNYVHIFIYTYMIIKMYLYMNKYIYESM